MAEERCGLCRFWEIGYTGLPERGTKGYGGDGTRSNCRRNAPVANPTATERYGGDAHWPVTRREDWCGLFEPHTVIPWEK